MEAAPLSPADITKSCFFNDILNGVNIANTAIGLAANVTNRVTKIEVGATFNILEGKDKSPSIKNRTICISPVTPSKK